MTVHLQTETEKVRAALAIAASRQFGTPAADLAVIEGLARQSGGASRQTWSFDAIVNGRREALILRRDPPTSGKTERSVAIDRATEFRVLRAAHRAGVRAPEPLFELAADDGL